MRNQETRRAMSAMFMAAMLLSASAAFAAVTTPAVGTVELITQAPSAPVAVLTASGIDRRALQSHLAQNLGPDSQRDLHRYRQDVFGTPVQIGVSHGRALAGPTFTPHGARDSASFERGATTGSVGLLNVVGSGLQRLGAN